MAISVPFTGGCVCGAIRYECSAEPLLMFNYHCRDCQRASGSVYYPGVALPTAAFRFTQSEPMYYAVQADSGNTTSRGFCPTCGAQVCGKSSGIPNMISVTASSLDDPSEFRPSFHMQATRAQPWDYLDPALPKIEHQPTSEDFERPNVPQD